MTATATHGTVIVRSAGSNGLRSFTRLVLVQYKLFLREPVALFFNIIFPTLLMLLFGLIWGNEPGSSIFSPHYGYIDAQVPALAAMVIGTVAFMTIPVATAAAREKKLLRRYQASPLPPLVYMAADVAVYLSIAVASMVTLVVISTLVFGLRFSGSWSAVAAAFLIAALAFIAVGYVIASLAPTSRVAQVVGQVLYFPMMFLSGAAVPLALMPDNVREFAGWLPLTYVVRLLQGLWFGGSWDTTALLVLAGVLLVGLVVSLKVFRWE